MSSHGSVISLEWACPGVSGGIILPFSVSVSFALEFLFSDVFISVSLSIFLLYSCGGGRGDECEDYGGDFHNCFT